MTASARAFVRRHTRRRPVPGLEHLRLHLADEVLPLWHEVQLETGDPDAPLPYWAFAWGGGLALAHYLRDVPTSVAGRRVLDLGAGSGLCALAAAAAGASEVTAVDIDPFAIAAIEVNARAAGHHVATIQRDILDDDPPRVDLILAGDCWYERGLADRVLPWLRRAAAAGSEVLIGDPRRRYLPVAALDEITTYEVRTTTELEDLERKDAGVYRLRAISRRPSRRPEPRVRSADAAEESLSRRAGRARPDGSAPRRSTG